MQGLEGTVDDVKPRELLLVVRIDSGPHSGRLPFLPVSNIQIIE